MSPVDDQLTEKLSELPKEILVRELIRTARTSDRTSQTNFLHYSFEPDDCVLELGARHLKDYGFLSDVPQTLPTLTFSPELSHNLDGGGPVHRLLIGDNFHALAGMQAYYAANPSSDGVYDLVYIDPPYNTGREDLAYNDKFVGADDPWRHTHYLSVMEPRLILARELLKSTGVIMVAIGGEELHTLKTLCDSVFGRHNFIDQVQWEGERKNNDRFISDSVEYMLVYAKNKSTLIDKDVYWLDRDANADAYFSLAQKVWDSTAHITDIEQRREIARKSFPAAVKKEIGHVAANLASFNRFDESGRLYSGGGDVSKPTGYAAANYFEVLHPVTGKPVKEPSRGYYCSEESFRKMMERGEIEFGKDETTQPKKRRFEYKGMIPGSVFNQVRSRANSHLAAIIGRDVFGNPKDHNVLARWFAIAAPKDAKILDFFGGSGSTAEAVLLLNQQDGGTREVTIVTNDAEITGKNARIGTDITRERIVRVMTGENWADGKPHDGYGGRLAVWKVGTAENIPVKPRYESVYHRLDASLGEWAVLADTPLLVEETESYRLFTNSDGTRHSVVYYDPDEIDTDAVDDILDRFPAVTSYVPVYANRSSLRFHVEDVPDAVPHPYAALNIINGAVSVAVHEPYTKRGVSNMNRLRVLSENKTAL